MKIGKLADETGVSTSQIRFYEKHGLVPPPIRLENGYRDYPEETVTRLRTIIMSKDLGFSLSEIRRILPDDPKDIMARGDVVANLKTKLAAVNQKIDELENTRKKVEEMIGYYEDPNSPVC